MDKKEYQQVSNDFSKVIKNFFLMLSQFLSHEFNIEMVFAGHIVLLHKDQIEEVCGATFALGCKEFILGIPDVLKIELEKYFKEIEEKELKKNIIAGFDVLEKNKKPVIH